MIIGSRGVLVVDGAGEQVFLDDGVTVVTDQAALNDVTGRGTAAGMALP